MISILMVPRGVEAATGLVERIGGLGGASARLEKRLRQLSNLKRATGLQALIDRPRVATRFGDQRRDADVAQLHGVVRSSWLGRA